MTVRSAAAAGPTIYAILVATERFPELTGTQTVAIHEHPMAGFRASAASHAATEAANALAAA